MQLILRFLKGRADPAVPLAKQVSMRYSISTQWQWIGDHESIAAYGLPLRKKKKTYSPLGIPGNISWEGT